MGEAERERAGEPAVRDRAGSRCPQRAVGACLTTHPACATWALTLQAMQREWAQCDCPAAAFPTAD